MIASSGCGGAGSAGVRSPAHDVAALGVQRPAAGGLVGHLYAIDHRIPDCETCPGPGAWFHIWAAGSNGEFSRLSWLDGAKRLTNYPPVFSSDGRFLRYNTFGNRDYVQRVDLARERLVGPRRQIRLDRGGLPQFGWSPTGDRFVLAGRVHARNGLWVARRDGSHLRQIVSNRDVRVQGSDWSINEGQAPVWSATGQIAFVAAPRRQRAHTFVDGIYVVKPDGSGLRQLLLAKPYDELAPDFSIGTVGSLSWSPDGTRLLFIDTALRVMQVRSRRVRLIDSRAGTPAWSPDGRFIAYYSGRSGRIRVVPAGGGHGLHHVPQLPVGAEAYSLAWLP
jgi:Tol biopolymer transport system component